MGVVYVYTDVVNKYAFCGGFSIQNKFNENKLDCIVGTKNILLNYLRKTP